MAIESIIEHILKQARQQRERIIAEAMEKKADFARRSAEEAAVLFSDAIKDAERAAEAERNRIMISGRLEAKKRLLEAKREILSAVFAEMEPVLMGKGLMKEQVLSDGFRRVPEERGFYLEKLRQDFESEIAGVLFS